MTADSTAGAGAGVAAPAPAPAAPAPAPTPTPAPDPDEAQRAIEYCYEQGWSDGLPLVPASKPLRRTSSCATTDKDPDEIIGSLEQVGRDCTVYLAAVNAAMAGCRPEYFPVVLAAFDALMRERAARGGGFQSTSGPAPLIVVNGPIRQELGFNTAGGAFGPGFRPNMTIPRAIGLIVRNAFGIHPHVLEQATQGVPGRWSICVAENEEESPWEPLGGTAAWAAASAPCRSRSPAPWSSSTTGTRPTTEDVLRDFQDTIGADRLADLPAELGRAGALPRARADVRRGRPVQGRRAELAASSAPAAPSASSGGRARRGHLAAVRRARRRGHDDGPPRADEEFHRDPVSGPRQIPIIVAGAKNAAISMVVRIFGEWSGTAVPGRWRRNELFRTDRWL